MKQGRQQLNGRLKRVEPLIYSGQVQLKVLNLPDGKDADEFLKSSPQATTDLSGGFRLMLLCGLIGSLSKL